MMALVDLYLYLLNVIDGRACVVRGVVGIFCRQGNLLKLMNRD